MDERTLKDQNDIKDLKDALRNSLPFNLLSIGLSLMSLVSFFIKPVLSRNKKVIWLLGQMTLLFSREKSRDA